MDTYLAEPGEDPLPFQSVTQLNQEYEFSKAVMCLTKIQFIAIEEAIQ
ncbi:hypothetical protein [Vibrio inusitatus]